MKYCLILPIFIIFNSCSLIDLRPEDSITTIPSREYEVIENSDEISISFAEDVDRLSVESITSLRRNGNKMEISFFWKDERNVIIKAFNQLFNGLEYRLELSGIYRNSAGVEREADRSVPFYIHSSIFTPLQVLNCNPADRTTLSSTGSVSISFNKAVDTATLNESLNISPSLEFTKIWSNDMENTLIIQADKGWKNLTHYKISLNESLYSREGDPLYPEWDLSFYAEDGKSIPSVVLYGSCLNDYSAEFPWISANLENLLSSQAIRIRFSESMNRDKTESSFKLIPPVSGDIYWRENDLIFSPVQGFTSSQNFRLEIGKESESSNGIAMTESFNMDFQPAIQEILLLNVECSSPGGFTLHEYSSIEAFDLPVQALSPFDLCFHFTFSEPFTTDTEKQKVQDSLSFYELFSSGGSPEMSLFSWSTDYIMTVIVSGFTAVSDSDFYYLMEIEGGLKGVFNSDGSYMKESVSQLFRVSRQ